MGDPSVRNIPWRRKWHPLCYSCRWNPMGRGAWQTTHSPWGSKESDGTERLSMRARVSQAVWITELGRNSTYWNRAGPYAPSPQAPHHPMSSACLLSVENFGQRISLIREMRHAETKENSQRRPNNNNVVIKHSQGPFFSRVIDNILSHLLWTALQILRQAEEVNYMMTRLYSLHKLLQF